MHLWKVSLHLVLSRFALPIELRAIIIEDYFPFLPNETYPLRKEPLHHKHGYAHFSNYIQLDCNTAVCLSKMRNGAKTHFQFIIEIKNVSGRTFRQNRCIGDCIKKSKYLQRCHQVFKRPSKTEHRIVSMLSPPEEWYDDLICWYHNYILDNIDSC